jgi:hypothetical protein
MRQKCHRHPEKWAHSGEAGIQVAPIASERIKACPVLETESGMDDGKMVNKVLTPETLAFGLIPGGIFAIPAFFLFAVGFILTDALGFEGGNALLYGGGHLFQGLG